MKKSKILIVEDDQSINKGIGIALGEEKYVIGHAYTLAEAKAYEPVDLIILDVNLPDGSGLDFLKELRRTSSVPVLILTANDTEMDEVVGLQLGADDYMSKPFSLSVLRLRAEKLLRRDKKQEILSVDGLSLDFERLQFVKDGREIDLSKTEIRLLRIFTENPGMILSREQLIDYVWQGQDFVDENALSVSVKRLRGKIADEAHPYISTVYGIGYVFRW